MTTKGLKFKHWIKDEGYTVTSFAKKLGCKPVTLYRIFNTSSATPTMAKLIFLQTCGIFDFTREV